MLLWINDLAVNFAETFPFKVTKWKVSLNILLYLLDKFPILEKVVSVFLLCSISIHRQISELYFIAHVKIKYFIRVYFRTIATCFSWFQIKFTNFWFCSFCARESDLCDAIRRREEALANFCKIQNVNKIFIISRRVYKLLASCHAILKLKSY